MCEGGTGVQAVESYVIEDGSKGFNDVKAAFVVFCCRVVSVTQGLPELIGAAV
jgi:hypothetical protein